MALRPIMETTACRILVRSRLKQCTSSERPAAELERPILLFSGGKDSIVTLHLAKKSFWPAPSPSRFCTSTPGAIFAEVLEFRDRHVAQLGVMLLVASVQEDIDAGRIVEHGGPRSDS